MGGKTTGKLCKHCGKRFHKKPGQYPSQFQKRISCSRKCATRLAAKTISLKVPAVKECVSCEKKFSQRSNESNPNYMRRRTCSPECFTKIRRKVSVPDEKYCTACGGPFSIRKGEAPSNFKKRATCGERCKGKGVRTARKYDIFGVMMSIQEMHLVFGIPSITIYTRLKDGCSPLKPRKKGVRKK